MIRRCRSRTTLRPTSMRPRWGCFSPAIISRIVVFPLPEGPQRAVTSWSVSNSACRRKPVENRWLARKSR